MEQITLPNRPQNLPASVAVLEFEHEGVLARVILTLSDRVENDNLQFTAQAYEMNADGSFKAAPNGFPSRTANTTHTVLASGLTVSKTATLEPGWIKHFVPGQAGMTAENLPEGAIALSELPALGNVGDLVFVDPWLWKWDEGIALHTAKLKVEELTSILGNSRVLSGLGFSFNR